MHWFTRKYHWYLPIHPMGWLICLGCTAFCGHIVLFMSTQTHSLSDMGYRIFPYIVPSILLYDRIAQATSKADV